MEAALAGLLSLAGDVAMSTAGEMIVDEIPKLMKGGYEATTGMIANGLGTRKQASNQSATYASQVQPEMHPHELNELRGALKPQLQTGFKTSNTYYESPGGLVGGNSAPANSYYEVPSVKRYKKMRQDGKYDKRYKRHKGDEEVHKYYKGKNKPVEVPMNKYKGPSYAGGYNEGIGGTSTNVTQRSKYAKSHSQNIKNNPKAKMFVIDKQQAMASPGFPIL